MTAVDRSILLVEDNDFDVKRVTRGFNKLGRNTQVARAHDGVEALEMLHAVPTQDAGTVPMVIMLDLNMPRMGGIEFLSQLRADERLRSLPVFVVTTSDFHLDISLAHQHLISGYFVKPDTAEEMVQVLKTLSDFWDLAVYPGG